MKPKCLVLFSGGLDSRLVIKIIQEQNIEIEAVYFKLPFGEGCCNNFSCVFNYLQTQSIKLHIIDCTIPPYLEDDKQKCKPKDLRGPTTEENASRVGLMSGIEFYARAKPAFYYILKHPHYKTGHFF